MKTLKVISLLILFASLTVNTFANKSTNNQQSSSTSYNYDLGKINDTNAEATFNKMEEMLAMVTPLPAGSCTICIEFSLEYFAGLKISVCVTEDTCEKAASEAIKQAKLLKNMMTSAFGQI